MVGGRKQGQHVPAQAGIDAGQEFLPEGQHHAQIEGAAQQSPQGCRQIAEIAGIALQVFLELIEHQHQRAAIPRQGQARRLRQLALPRGHRATGHGLGHRIAGIGRVPLVEVDHLGFLGP